MPDPIYVVARAVLLDALDALRIHLNALVLVGAQAVYLRAGEGDLAVAPYTTDGDLAINPELLQRAPDLAAAMLGARFQFRDPDVGRWWAERKVDGRTLLVPIDLLVPDALGGSGRRSARLEGHSRNSARKVVGLEASLVDNDLMVITALDPNDKRTFEARVAGPGGLLVAKAHKIADRSGGERARDKDALDIYRLLRASDPDDVAKRMQRSLDAEVSASVATAAVGHLRQLFADRGAEGCAMAARAAGGDPEVALGASVLVREVLDQLV